VTTPIDFYAAQ